MSPAVILVKMQKKISIEPVGMSTKMRKTYTANTFDLMFALDYIHEMCAFNCDSAILEHVTD